MSTTASTHESTGEKIWRYCYLTFCWFVFLFLIAPIIVIIPLSFNSEPYFTYPMAGFSMRWYEALLADDPQGILWRQAFGNSLIVGISATLLATALGTLAALGLNRVQFALKGLLLAVLISPLIVPIVITAVATFYFYAKVGLAATYLGLILAHTTLGVPFVVITVTATLSGFDYNMIRAGASLGANPARVFRKVTLPLILPGVISGGLFAFITSFDEVVVMLFLAGFKQRTIPRQMWAGIREQISPTILAVATVLILFSICLMFALEMLRRRNEKLRGIRET